MCLPQDPKLPGGHPSLPSLADRERQQLRDVGTDEDARLADAKELVDEGQEYRKQNANGPGAHGRARGRRVVLVVDDGADLGVGAVVGDQGGFELHLRDERLVLLRVVENVVVLEESLDPL